MNEVKIDNLDYIGTDNKEQLNNILEMYMSQWEPNSDKLSKFFSENLELANIIFSRGICEGILICKNKEAFNANLALIKGN
jgi:hypothetical protein